MKKNWKWILVIFLVSFIIFVEWLLSSHLKIQNEDISYIIFVCFASIGLIVYQILTEPSEQNSNDFEIVFNENNTYVKYKEKYEFVFEGKALDIQIDELAKDKNGKEVSFTDMTKIYNYIRYAYSKSIEDSPEERNILKNKFLLDSLNENCEGIRKATKGEKKKYKRIKILEFCILLLMSIMLVFMIFVGVVSINNSPKVLTAMPLLIVIAITFSVFTIWKKVKELKGAIYFVIDCYVCDRKERSSKGNRIYEIRVKDKNELYVDKWFNCKSFTYESDEVKVIVAKLTNGKCDVKLLEESIFGE